MNRVNTMKEKSVTPQEYDKTTRITSHWIITSHNNNYCFGAGRSRKLHDSRGVREGRTVWRKMRSTTVTWNLVNVEIIVTLDYIRLYLVHLLISRCPAPTCSNIRFKLAQTELRFACLKFSSWCAFVYLRIHIFTNPICSDYTVHCLFLAF